MWTPDIVLYNSAGDGEQGREMRTLIQVRTFLLIAAVQILQAENKKNTANYAGVLSRSISFNVMRTFWKGAIFILGDLRWVCDSAHPGNLLEQVHSRYVEITEKYRVSNDSNMSNIPDTNYHCGRQYRGKGRPLSVYKPRRPFSMYFNSFPFCFENNLSRFCALPSQGKQKIKLQ